MIDFLLNSALLLEIITLGFGILILVAFLILRINLFVKDFIKSKGGTMPKLTLTNYIKRTSDDALDKIFHLVIAEMNRRKAKKQNVDVGFWDSEGNYTEDIQPVDADELAEILRDENE